MEDGGGLRSIGMCEVEVEEIKETICDMKHSNVKCLIFISTLLCKCYIKKKMKTFFLTRSDRNLFEVR